MATPDILFSIIIPAYNYGHTLPRALASVLVQKSDDVEILVINDGSTDDTETVLAQLHEQYSDKFRSVKRENSGLAATRNYGVTDTTGQWLIFLDSDDELEVGALAALRTTIEAYPQARMIVGGHKAIEPDGDERYRGVDVVRCMEMTNEQLFSGYLLDKSITPSNGSTAMHRELFDHIDYPESFRSSEDIPVFSRIFANYPCAFVDQAIGRVYKHPDSLRHNTAHADAVSTQLIDVVFDPANIPDHLQVYKKPFAAQRCLSMFRTFYLAGDKKRARYYYREALKYHWLVIFNLSYTKKALRCLL